MARSYRFSAGTRLTGVTPPAVAVVSRGEGTGSGQFTVDAVVEQTLDPGQVLTLNLFNGSLSDPDGNPAFFARLNSFYANVESGGDSSGVKVAPGASNGNTLWWGGTGPYKTIYPSSEPEVAGSQAGVTVDATHANVTLTNLGAVAAAVMVVLVGCGPLYVNFFPGSLLPLGIG